MVARLRYYFQRAFITPLFVGVMLSIVFTGFIFINYTRNIEKNQNIIPIFRDMELKINVPYIETAKGLLFKHFQPMINNLLLFKKFYQSLKSDYFSSDLAIKENFINKYSLNAFDLVENYTNCIERISKDDNSTYLDHGLWLKDNETKRLGDLHNSKFEQEILNKNDKSIAKEQLFYATNMLPIFRSIIENKGNQTKNSIKHIYMAFENTELFYMYPIENTIDSNKTDYYSFFNRSTYPTYCHNPLGKTLNYYYFKCQPWWKEIIDFKEINGFDISITMPYTYAQDNSKGITLCARFNDTFVVNSGSKEYSNTTVAVCIDSYLDEINFTLDYFSKNLNGYFFIMRLNSDVPIYYPLNNFRYGQTSISNYEFDFNVTFFLNELDDFRVTKNHFFKFIDLTNQSNVREDLQNPNTQVYHGQFQKNNLIHNYTVVPVSLYLNDEQPTRRTHFFSIVLLMSKDMIVSLSDIQYLNSRIITLLIVLAFFGLILLLIGKYLINALADNIVRPLRSLKFIIQGMNNKQLIEDKEYTKQEEEIDSKVAREDADISFERTEEIERFGEMIIKLQNVLKFTTNNKNSNDHQALVKYVYSKYSFQDVNNVKGTLYNKY